MSHYILIRRLRGPAILLLIGTLALLHQMGAIPHFWKLFWPLLLIMLGVLMLAERAALASEGYPIFPGAPWHDASQGMNSGAGQGSASSGTITGTAIAPLHPHDFENDREGEQQ